MKKSNGEGKERDEEKKMVLVVATNDEIEELTNECTPHATLLLIIIAASASAIVVQVSYEFYSRGPFTAAACTLTLTLIKTTIQYYTIQYNTTGKRRWWMFDNVVINSATAVLSALANYQLFLLPYHHILVVINKKKSSH